MEIEIALAGASKKRLVDLKSYVDKAAIDGIQDTSIATEKSDVGQMSGVEILNSIKAIIHAAEKPLVELVKCLQKYVDNYRTEITIFTKGGGKVILSHGRSMKPEELQSLVKSIHENID